MNNMSTNIVQWDFSKESIKIYDDFLTKEQYIPIYQYFLDNHMGYEGDSVPWYWIDGIVEMGDGLVQFVNMCYAKDTIINPVMYNILMPIFNNIKPMALHRIKANLTLSKQLQDVDLQKMLHVDSPYCHDCGNMNTGIYYVNSNDGGTLFEDGTKVESVANRFVVFPCNMKHAGVPASNVNRRVVINFNWF